MTTALYEALVDAGVRPLKPRAGGWLEMTFVGTEPLDGDKNAKVYQANYKPPEGGEDIEPEPPAADPWTQDQPPWA